MNEAGGGHELDLIERARGGDSEAFALLYDQYADQIYRYVFYRVRNRDDSEDLTQQVFMRAWGAIGRYRVTEAPFVAWLFTIAHNSVASFGRRTRGQEPLDEATEVADEAADPQLSAERRFREIAVRQAIGGLKIDQQRVVVLRYLAELEYGDIARALGKTEANARQLMHRALQRLGRVLGDV
ncbi:MAG TPA: sigma-70 family RNA polymerase sigma factor [Solirubrobacteraceae bacterium]|nr:sigma-70 family RNA polymerase sigma factor [Solirubrobacteraceae bacterium]